MHRPLGRRLRLLCVQRLVVRSRPVPERLWGSVCGGLRCVSGGELQQHIRQAPHTCRLSLLEGDLT